MKIEKLTDEKLTELENQLIKNFCMDLILFNIINSINELPKSGLDNDHLRDLNTLRNNSHLSPREKEICLKYIKIIIDRNIKG